MMMSEVGQSHNQFQMGKQDPVIETDFMSEESLESLGLTVEVLELYSLHMHPRDPLPLAFLFSSWTRCRHLDLSVSLPMWAANGFRRPVLQIWGDGAWKVRSAGSFIFLCVDGQ